jgi:beta-glucanase (GH16 family)
MKHSEADSTLVQISRRDPRGRCPLSILFLLALFVLGGVLAGCRSSIGTASAGDQTQVTIIATALPAGQGSPALGSKDRPGYRLRFNEEFDGKSLDPKRWVTSLPWGNTNRAEQQYYSPSALSLADGQLTITATRGGQGSKAYTSGAICTDKLFDFKYGYAEERAMVPKGAGLWSAFWLLRRAKGSNEEADIIEALGSDTTQGFNVLHYGSMANREVSVSTFRTSDLATGFHVFGLEWEPGLMVWYVDGIERHRATVGVPSDPMIVIANLAVGGPGSWSGAPDGSTGFPARYKIDYIRVWQR